MNITPKQVLTLATKYIRKIKLLDYAKLFQTKYKCTHFPD